MEIKNSYSTFFIIIRKPVKSLESEFVFPLLL